MNFLNFGLGTTIDMLREAVCEFAECEIRPKIDYLENSTTTSRDLWKKLGDLGLLGITVEEAYGGSGLGYLEHVIVMSELSRVLPAIGLSYGAHSNLCVNQIRLHGSELQKQKYLPKLCSGEYIGALAISEVQAGSDVMSMQLRAERVNDKFVLNGTKMWITNGPDADVLVVYAKTLPEGGSHGISAFIIERKFEGFSAAQKLDKLGMRASHTSELVFENCLVPQENLLGNLHEGTKILMCGLDYERVILSGGPLGIMKACLDLVLPYVRMRKQFGRAIGEFELIQAKLANIYTEMTATEAHIYAVAKACDKGNVSRKDAAAVILNAAEKATWAAGETIQCLGGNGYINEYPAARLWRDAKLYEIGAGTSEIRRMLIGRELFKS